MSSTTPSGVTVYVDGESSNYPTATDAAVDANQGTLTVLGDRKSDLVMYDHRTLAIYAPTRWDSVDVHDGRAGDAEPADLATLTVGGLQGLIDERITAARKRDALWSA